MYVNRQETSRLQAGLEAIFEGSSQSPELLQKIKSLKEKKRDLKASLLTAQTRIKELETELSSLHSNSPATISPRFPESDQTSLLSSSTDLLGFDSNLSVGGLPAVHLDDDMILLPKQEYEEIVPDPANHDFYVYSCGWAQGLLYKDLTLEVFSSVDFTGGRGQVAVMVTNKATSPITDIRISFKSDPELVQLTVDPVSAPTVLSPESQYNALISVRCVKPFLSPPLLLMQYQQKSSKVQVALELPVPVTRFVQPKTRKVEEAFQLFTQLKLFSDRIKFAGLRTDIKNMNAVAEVFSCNNAFRLYLPHEIGKPRTIIGVGEGLSQAIITKVELSEKAEHIEVSCCCEDETLRGAILALLKELLQEPAGK